MNFKRLLLAVVISCTMVTPVSAMTTEQAKSQLHALMEYLMKNYAGRKLTVDELYLAAARGLTDPLDEYSEYLSAAEYQVMADTFAGNFKGIGIQFSVRLDGGIEVVGVIDDSPAKKAGIQKGDLIRKVNQTAVNGYDSEPLAQMIADAADRLTLEIVRGGDVKTYTLTKAEVHTSTVDYGMLGMFLTEAADRSGMGYILVTQIGENTADEISAAIDWLKPRGVTQLVMDLRGNPGGLKNVIDEISQMFVPRGVIYSTIDAAGDQVFYRSRLKTPPFRDVVILVDGDTASACELFTSAMQDAKAATVIGQRTFGKGIIQSFAELPTGDTLKYTSMEYLRRSGTKLHGIGVTPDILVTKPKPLGDEMFIMNNDGTGPGVKNCKQLLAYMGYTVDGSDNRYTTAAKNAVMDIQKRAGLKSTGAFDVQTVRAVNTAYQIYTKAHDSELIRAYELLRAR